MSEDPVVQQTNENDEFMLRLKEKVERTRQSIYEPYKLKHDKNDAVFDKANATFEKKKLAIQKKKISDDIKKLELIENEKILIEKEKTYKMKKDILHKKEFQEWNKKYFEFFLTMYTNRCRHVEDMKEEINPKYSFRWLLNSEE